MSESKFIFITDTHIGRTEKGYQLQPRYDGFENELFIGLGKKAKEQNANLIVHSGDLTDHGHLEEIIQAKTLIDKTELPMALCLGNHDLSAPGYINNWLNKAQNWMRDGQDCFSIKFGKATLVLVSHHWQENKDWHWEIDKPQEPRLDDKQIKKLDSLIGAANNPVIAITHAPLNDVDSSQRGTDKPFHPPHKPYAQIWQSLAGRHKNLKLVLAGHNHSYSFCKHKSFTAITAPAFCETPAQALLITINQNNIKVKPFSIAKYLNWDIKLDPKTAWCAGEGKEMVIDLS